MPRKPPQVPTCHPKHLVPGVGAKEGPCLGSTWPLFGRLPQGWDFSHLAGFLSLSPVWVLCFQQNRPWQKGPPPSQHTSEVFIPCRDCDLARMGFGWLSVSQVVCQCFSCVDSCFDFTIDLWPLLLPGQGSWCIPLLLRQLFMLRSSPISNVYTASFRSICSCCLRQHLQFLYNGCLCKVSPWGRSPSAVKLLRCRFYFGYNTDLIPLLCNSCRDQGAPL